MPVPCQQCRPWLQCSAAPKWREAAGETSIASLNLPVSVAAKYRKLGIEISSQKSIGDTVIDTSPITPPILKKQR